MKIWLPLLLLTLISYNSLSAQSVGISNTASTPDPSAILDVKSISQGILIPRMTTLQRTTISTPAKGLLVFDLETDSFWFHDGTMWVNLSSGGPTDKIVDADNDTKIEVEKNTDEDVIRFSTEGVEIAKMDGQTFHFSSPGKSLYIGNDAGQNDTGVDNYNIAIGDSALYKSGIGERNIAIGNGTLFELTHQEDNIAIGDSALHSSGLGTMSSFSGSKNIAIGKNAGILNTTGNRNTFIGVEAGIKNTTGSNNLFLGRWAGSENVNGFNNINIGNYSGFNNIDGDYNVNLGNNSGYYNQSGNRNTNLGYNAGTSNLTGSLNIMIGNEAGYNETGSEKLYIDNSNTATPLIYGEFDNNLIRINGTLDINNNYQLPLIDGTNNQVIQTDGSGNLTWEDLNTGAININGLNDGKAGLKNTFLGYKSGFVANYSIGNTGVGAESLEFNISGVNNTAIGYKSMEKTNGGTNNTSIGMNAMSKNTTGSHNVAMGVGSLSFAGLGSDNTSIGTNSGSTNPGSNNVFIGTSAGRNSTGDSNVLIGSLAGYFSTGGNKLYIENSNSNSPLIYGEFDNDLVKINGRLDLNGNYSLANSIGSTGSIMLNQGPGSEADWSPYRMPSIKGTNDQILKTNTAGIVSWQNDLIDDADASPTNELQSLSINGNDLSISGGNTVSFPAQKWIVTPSNTNNIYYTNGFTGIGTIDPASWLHVNGISDLGTYTIYGIQAGHKTGINISVNNQPGLNSIDSIIGLRTLAEGSHGVNIGLLAEVGAGAGERTAMIADAGSALSTAAKFNGEVIFGTDYNQHNEVHIRPSTVVSGGDVSLFLSEDNSSTSGMIWKYDGTLDELQLFGQHNNSLTSAHITVDRDFGVITFGNDDFIFNPSVGGHSRFTTDELEIRGGSDLAENFDISDLKLMPRPGMLVSIDTENPGRLKLTTDPYCPLLAGVISGAEGINPGMRMGQKGTIADGEYPITLTGRVYVKVNDEGGIIHVGDVITSSSIQGEGMKADYNQIKYGTCIGKVLSTVNENGYVLVLVNLN